MLIISTVPQAVGLMVAGVFLLGSWPIVWHKVEAGGGRLPAHVFLDYSLTYLAFATAVALTLGQLGPPAHHPVTGASLQFFDQLTQASSNWQMVVFALAGGTCLALGDLALQYSITLCGLSIGPPVLNATTLIVGVLLAFFLDGGINSPGLVFTGAAWAAVAIALGGAAHVVNQRASSASTSAGSSSSSKQEQGGSVDDSAHSVAEQCCRHRKQGSVYSSTSLAAAPAVAQQDESSSSRSDIEAGQVVQPQRQHQHLDSVQHQDDSSAAPDNVTSSSHACGCSQQPSTPQERASQSAGSRRHTWVGLLVALVGGAVYGCFLPAFQVAANDPWHLLPAAAAPLSVYTTFFWFAIAFSSVSLAVNARLLYRPALGGPRSSVAAYLRDHRGRGLSIASGLLAASGDLCQFIGGQTVGYAAAMMCMSYPILGVLWGVLGAGEGRRSAAAPPDGKAAAAAPTQAGARRVQWGLLLVGAQLACYVLSVGLLAGSAELRGGGGAHR